MFDWRGSIESHCQLAAVREMGRYLREEDAPLEDLAEKKRAFDVWGLMPYQTPWDAIHLPNDLDRKLDVAD